MKLKLNGVSVNCIRGARWRECEDGPVSHGAHLLHVLCPHKTNLSPCPICDYPFPKIQNIWNTASDEY